MNIHIRPGCVEELPELIKLQTLSIRAFYTGEYEPEEIDSLVKSQAEVRHLVNESIVVAEVDQKIVGFASISDQAWQIDAVYVHPDWARQGVGKTLLASIETIALERRYRSLSVMASTIASLFYQSQGYKIRQPFEFRIGSDICIPCQILEKRLLPPVSFSEWAYRHRFILLLSLGLITALTFCHAKKQNQQPQFDAPSQEVRFL